jgi:hypothetical protein
MGTYLDQMAARAEADAAALALPPAAWPRALPEAL